MKVIETGRNALLQCQAVGSPGVTIYWVKDTLRLLRAAARVVSVSAFKYPAAPALASNSAPHSHDMPPLSRQ